MESPGVIRNNEATINLGRSDLKENLNYLKLFNFEDFDVFSLARHCKYVELEALLIKGLNPDSKDEYGNTILIIGSQNGNKRVIKMALRFGGQINMFNNVGNTALHFSNEYKYDQISEYLVKKGANPEIKNLKGIKAKDGFKKPDKNAQVQTGTVKISTANKFINSTNMKNVKINSKNGSKLPKII